MYWLKRELNIAYFVGLDAGTAWLCSWLFQVEFIPLFLLAVAFTANRALWNSMP